MLGGAGNDSLDGGDGNDTYIFGAVGTNPAAWGNDTIANSSGADIVDLSNVTGNLAINLNAGSGDEVSDGTNTINWSSINMVEDAIGGTGNDTITGGSGNDTYKFNSGDGPDLVIDSAGTADKITLGSSITQSVVAVFKTTGGDLQIGYTNKFR